MPQIRDAAIRLNRIVDVLKERGPMTAGQLVEVPAIREVSPYDTAVLASLNTIRGRGLVRRIPSGGGKGKHRYMWEFVDKSAGKSVVLASTPHAANDTTEQGTVDKPVVVERREYTQVASAVIKPEVKVEADRIVITHPACNIVISLLT